MFKKIMTILLAALSLFAATTAQANSAHSLSLGQSPVTVRAASDAGRGSELVGGAAWVLAAIGAGLAIWGVVELVESDSN